MEPDVSDQLAALAEAGTRAVVVCPIGFVADHIEVVWDLDNELKEQADAAGIVLARATTPNAQPRFAQLALDLVDEVREGREPVRAGGGIVPGYGFSVNGSLCTPACSSDARPTAESR